MKTYWGSYLLDKYWFTDVLQKSSIKICGHWGLFDSMMLLLKKGVFFGETDLAWHQAPPERFFGETDLFFGETDLAWHQAPLENPAYLS